MAERDVAYLSWNIVNWITVVLMVGLGYALIGLVSQGLKTYGPLAQSKTA